MNAKIANIAGRGGQSNFGARMAAARKAAPKKTPRAAGFTTPGVSSNAPPNPVVVGKGTKPTRVKQPKTVLPQPVMKGTPAPGMGKAKGSHAAKGATIVHNHYYGSNDSDGDE